MKEKGNISIQAENIMPVIKKWLYSDKDIFIREMVSNAADAITKYNKLVSLGEAEAVDGEELCIRVIADKERGTLKFIDNGIGMTADEIKKYINSVAFSGAEEFLAKYAGKDESSQIIGHFGLGFYSAFMVADSVGIDTLSYMKDAEPASWYCAGGMEYEISVSDRTARGTEITLYIAPDEKEFLEHERLHSVLDRYCAFLPYPIYIEETDGTREQINDTDPLWARTPGQCSKDDYIAFYRKLFTDMKEPLFWLHLNVDYPFRLQGILYFPRWDNEYDRLEGRIKLYNNKVFIADNISDVIPEYLTLLRGVLDCPDLPLNVSRSFLQNDGYVRRISEHIVRKVCDKLTGMFKNSREEYESYWPDIRPFMQYGSIKDEKFYDRMKDSMLFGTTDDEFMTLSEYAEKSGAEDKKIYYLSSRSQQASYAEMFRGRGIKVAVLDSPIDPAYMQFLESKNPGLKFVRVDSELSDKLTDGAGSVAEGIEEAFRKAGGDDKLVVRAEKLKAEDAPAIMLQNEYSRRFKEMSERFGGGFGADMFPREFTLVLNENHPLVQKLPAIMKGDEKLSGLIFRQIYDLAMMGIEPLPQDKALEFTSRSFEIMNLLASDKAQDE